MNAPNEPAVNSIRAALAAYPGETFSLLVGEPYYGPPAAVRGALERAAQSAPVRYGDPAGERTLREAICAYERVRGLDIEPEQVVIGNGAKGLLYGLLTLLGREGLILPLPTYPAIIAQARLLDLPLKSVPMTGPDFDIDPSHLPDAGGGCLYLGSPSNPTGRIVPPDTAERLITWCGTHDVRLIADEVYGDLVHSGDFVSFGCFDPTLERAVIVRSFSKSLGICGWRLGYVLADRRLAAALARWQSIALNPPSTLVQEVVAAMAEHWGAEITAHRAHFHKAAKSFAGLFARHGLRATPAEGSFYLFFETPPETGSLAWCEALARETGIGIWPGEDFGVPGWARLSFGAIAPEALAGTLDELDRRLRRFAALDKLVEKRLHDLAR